MQVIVRKSIIIHPWEENLRRLFPPPCSLRKTSVLSKKAKVSVKKKALSWAIATMHLTATKCRAGPLDFTNK